MQDTYNINNTISFIGLGKLGLPLATIFAKNDVDVIGIDKNKNLINILNNGDVPFYEMGLRENLSESNKNITYTTEYDGVVDVSDISIILVNTQIDKSYSSEYVISAITDLCNELKDSVKSYHLFILSSTVLPGEIENKFIPLIEEITDRKLNDGFGFCYVPDIVKLGSVIKDFENPDVIIIGKSDDYSGKITKELYQCIPKNKPPIVEMSLSEAEVSKVALNAYLVTKISFANFLSNLCEEMDNVNVDNVTNAIGFHKPISPYFLKGGLSFGGTCFPRDTWTFIELAKRFGLDAKQLIATDEINKQQDDRLYKSVIESNKENISILGLSFKPHSPVIIESPSIKLIKNLLKDDKVINVYDPLCLDEVKNKFGDKINYFDSVEDCFKSGELVVVALEYDEFKLIDDRWKSFDEQIILDCWRLLDKDKYNKLKYKCFGKKNA
tara:strand:- start:35 stop:1357 length:1323 start_codon:yes stop_codon:yes gene_type:complete